MIYKEGQSAIAGSIVSDYRSLHGRLTIEKVRGWLGAYMSPSGPLPPPMRRNSGKNGSKCAHELAESVDDSLTSEPSGKRQLIMGRACVDGVYTRIGGSRAERIAPKISTTPRQTSRSNAPTQQIVSVLLRRMIKVPGVCSRIDPWLGFQSHSLPSSLRSSRSVP